MADNQVTTRISKHCFLFIIVFSKPGKSPIQILNELSGYPGGSKVKIADKGSYGPPHEPLHVTCVSLENIGSFLGRAKSKQDAKQQGARLAIGFLQQLRFSWLQSGLGSTKKRTTTSAPASTKKSRPTLPENSKRETIINTAENSSTDENGHNVSAEVKPSKEEQIDMKTMASQVPAESLLDNEVSKAIYDAIMTQSSVFAPESIENLIERTSPANKAQFNPQDLWKYKEIAGFVLISDVDQSVKVLSLATGTKCISSEYISLYGDVVHDCHAEIVARRSLICVLYEQLQALLDNQLNGTSNFWTYFNLINFLFVFR